MERPINIHIEILEHHRLEEVLSYIIPELVRREPFSQALSLSESDLRNCVPLEIEQALPERLSLVALEPATNRFLGCLIAKDLLTPAPADLAALCPAMEPGFALLDQLHDEYLTKTMVSKGEVLQVLFAVVFHQMSNLGIYTQLRQMAHQYAKQRGFKRVLGEATGVIVQYVLLKKFGQKVVAEIDYQSFRYQGKPTFASITSPRSCMLIEGIL